MQEEVNQKTISLCINGGRISARILKDAMRRVLTEMGQEKGGRAATRRDTTAYRGKQSMKKLMGQGCQISNIEVTDGNIKSFERCARRYDIDFSLKKDTSISPPRYLVFFKAKDVDVMTAAFREYTGKSLDKDKRPSVRRELTLAKERAAQHREREKTRRKERGPEH